MQKIVDFFRPITLFSVPFLISFYLLIISHSEIDSRSPCPPLRLSLSMHQKNMSDFDGEIAAPPLTTQENKCSEKINKFCLLLLFIGQSPNK